MQEFATLAETKSYVHAATLLGIPSATLSRHISEMEESLGISLFSRTTREVELTPHGLTMLSYAYKLIEIEHSYKRELEKYKRNVTGCFSVGVLPCASQYGIIELLISFQKTFPMITLQIIDNTTYDLIDLLSEGKIDVAFVWSTQSERSGYMQFHLIRDRIVAIVPKNHRFANLPSISLEQLANDEFIARRDHSFLFEYYRDIFKRNGIKPLLKHLSASGNNVEDAVQRGMGVSLQQERLARSMQNIFPNYAIVPLEPEEPIYIDIICRKDSMSRIGRVFWGTALSSTELYEGHFGFTGNGGVS